VCGVLDHWPLLYNGQGLQAASVGVGITIAAALICMVAWVVLRGLLNLLPLAPLTDRCVSRAVGGALCGVGLATFYLLLSLHDFTAVTSEEFLSKVFLSWSSAAPWAAAVFSLLSLLSTVPDFWRRRTLRAAKG